MPYVGSVNQIAPPACSTTSFGLFSRLPWYRSASTVTEPSGSSLVTCRPPCSQLTSRPCRSTVCPLANRAGCRNTPTAPVVSSQRSSRSLGMSLNTRYRPAGK